MKKNIYDGKGKYIGYTNDIGNVVHGYNKSGKPVGMFNKISNYTYDHSGKPLAKGNLIEGLVMMMNL